MSNIIDTIQLSGTVYTIQGSGGAVSSAITSGDTNPVEGGVLYDELRVVGGVETKVELEFSGSRPKTSTNFPSGCTKIEVSNFAQYQEIYLCFESMGGVYGIVAYVYINNGEVSVHEEIEGCNPIYTISGDNLILTWTNVSQTSKWVTHIQYYSNGTIQPEINAILSETQIVPLIDQVSANTQAITGKQDTLSAGTGIQISGNVISATGGGGGNPTVELTQAEYDDLVSAGTVSADTYYIITDAQAGDLTQYWTSAQTNSAINQAVSGKANSSDVYLKTETSGATELSTAFGNKQDTLVSGTNIKTVNNESLLGSGNITIQGGGGTTYSAGRGIDITNDTISSTLPISAGTGTNSAIIGYYNSGDSYWNSKASGEGAIASGLKCTASGQICAAIGYNNTASGGYAASNFAQGYMTTASGNRCHSEGLGTSSTADASHSEGCNTTASGNYSHSEGEEVKATNVAEHSQGRFNVSNKANTTWGDSGNTLFSVGNGTADNARHNAFEIRQNGDIYCNNGTSDVKLQDYIQIKVMKLTQQEYDALSPNYDNNTLYVIT